MDSEADEKRYGPLDTIPKGFRPMGGEAAPTNLSTINYPVLVSPKLDGIRCVIFGGVAYSRRLKPIPNEWIQSCLSTLPDGIDGELIVGMPFKDSDNPDDSVMQRTSSGVMSKDGRPDFTFFAFDWHGAKMEHPFEGQAAKPPYDTWVVDGFAARRMALAEAFHGEQREGLPIQAVPHYVANNEKELLEIEAKFVAQGYEGAMIRAPHGPYKYGKSTAKQGWLMKLKRFHDAEATVIDYVERLHNANEAKRNAIGYVERSTAKDGKVPMDTLGALVCVWDKDWVPTWKREDYESEGLPVFEVGTGFTDAQRKQIWNERQGYRGGLAKIKYQEITSENVPRFAVWLGWRSEIDA